MDYSKRVHPFQAANSYCRPWALGSQPLGCRFFGNKGHNELHQNLFYNYDIIRLLIPVKFIGILLMVVKTYEIYPYYIRDT